MRSTSLAIGALVLSTCASAAPSSTEQCRNIADPAARLACYDRAADEGTAGKQGRSAERPAAAPAPSPSSPTTASEPPRAAPPTRATEKAPVNGQIVAVRPLRHGYFALELDNGAIYETTVVGTPPPVGAEVHIRRTLLGTTFFDIKGWSPITVRPSRQR
jgi:hypothetical protein